jgi:hypothetical protein
MPGASNHHAQPAKLDNGSGAAPRLLCGPVVVSSNARRNSPVVAQPSPSFGWDILDAVRAHAEAAAV